MRHVAIMTLTGSVGLVAIFLVDFIDMFFLSLLGEVAIAAAIGYAGTILFFTISLGIGIAIAAGALVSRALGAGDREEARRLATSSVLYMVLASVAISIVLFPLLPMLLDLLGAEGRTRELSLGYLQIMVASTPLLGIGMASGALLRAVGDAKRAMYVTLSGGVVNAVLDPIFIFGFDWGVNGAALASVCSRIALVAWGYYGLVKVHDMLAPPSFYLFRPRVPALTAIAMPAILTNLATPAGNAYITAAIADFGDGAVAGWAIVGRLIPVAFGVVFSLSGAVGPILGQNLGARRFDRVRATFRDSLIFCSGYVLLVWLALFLAQDFIIAVFQATGEAAELISLFCAFVAGSFLFNGALFVSNAAFNNLGYPRYSTVLNWGKASVGTVPFVWVGGWLGGAPGVLIGQGVGAVVFGILAALVCYRVVIGMERDPPPPDAPKEPPVWRHALWPFSSGKSMSAN